MVLRQKPSMGPLSEYLERVKQLPEVWDLTSGAERPGEERRLWFRGHQDAAWKLTPRLYRQPFAGAEESEIRQEFQRRAPLSIPGRLPINKWEWYFLMQHYGAPTRLLDWTENPLVAMYFAVVGHQRKTDAAVWVLDPWWLNPKLKRGIEGPMLSEWKEADAYLPDLEAAFAGKRVTVRLPAAIEPPQVDRRMEAQASRFVIFGTTKDLMRTRAASTGPPRRKHVAIIRIASTQIKEVQRDLEQYGVTASSVFPDLEGLCREICSKWKKR